MNLGLPGNGSGTSTDGRQWVSHPLPDVNSPMDAIWTGTHWVAVGWCSNGYKSLDGIVWEKWQHYSTCGDFSAVQAVGSRVVARGTRLETSDDMTKWITAERGSYSIDEISDMAFDGKTLVAVGHQGALETSTDGLHWTSRRYGSGYSIYAAAVGPQGIAAIGSNMTLFSDPSCEQ